MWFLIGGLVLLGLWWGDIGPVAHLHWAWVLLPFALAVVWWAVADATGITQRRAVDKMEARKVARRQRDMEALGLDVRRDKRVRVMRESKSRPPAAPPPPQAKKDAEPAAEPPRRDPRL